MAHRFLRLSIRLFVLAASVSAAADDRFGADAIALRQHRPQVIRLVLVGDTGNPGTQLHEAIARVEEQEPIDAVLLLGDNFYPCGVESRNDEQWTLFRADLGRVTAPTFAVLGNHDYGNPGPRRTLTPPCVDSNPSAQISSRRSPARWTMPARNYEVLSELIHIVMVDTNPVAYSWETPFLGSATSRRTVEWLGQTLSKSQARWKIVAGHHPIYSSGNHGTSRGSSISAMRRVLPLLKKNEVAVYAAGHDHALELIGARDEDLVFVVSGAGSFSEPYRRRSGSEPPTIWKAPGGKSFEGFALLTASRSQLVLEFFDVHGRKRGGYLTRHPSTSADGE